MPVAEQAGMETARDPPFSTSELKNAVFRLQAEKGLISRTRIVTGIGCRTAHFSSDLRIVAEALITCWGDLRYSGSELSEWRMCVIQSADRPIRLAREMPEILILYTDLAVKAGTWCTQITSGDLVDSSFQRDSRIEIAQIQQAVIRLTSTLFEAAVEVCLTVQSPTFEEPLEGLISTSFELARVIYVSMTRKPSPPSLDDDALRKRCQELLNFISRLALHFRRKVGNNNKISEASDVSQQESSPGSRTTRQSPTALRIVSVSIKSWTELGKLSTYGGEINLGLLNISWKSLVTLLQVDGGRDVVASVVDIPSIVATLISNSVQQAKEVLESWLAKPPKVREKDPRKQFVPNKFLLISAGKISSLYPLQAVKESRNMASWVSKAYACLLQKDLLFDQKAAAEAFAEVVVPQAFALLQNFLNDERVHDDLKIQVLRYITVESDELDSSQTVTDLDGCNDGNDVLDELFCDKAGGLLKTGRVVLFLSVLLSSSGYSGALLSELLAKLPWLLDGIPEEGTYVLMTQRVYLPDDSSDVNGKWKWQLMFAWASKAIKVFAAVAAKHEPVWREFQYFFFEHVLHPSAICGQLVLDVWSFVMGQSDLQLAQDHVDSLLKLFRELVAVKAEAPLQRRIARAICVLLQAAPESVVSRVSDDVAHANPFKSPLAADVIAKLVEEGFPLDKPGSERLLSSGIACGKGLVESLKLESRGLESKLAVQKPALICIALLLSQRWKLAQSDARVEPIEEKYMQEIKLIVLNLISMYTLDRNNSRLFHNLGVIGLTLELIRHVLHLLDPGVFEALLPRLLECCQTTPESEQSRELKQSLPAFLSSLSNAAFEEVENNPATKALWGLFHFLLREQPWALVHSGLESFANFAAHTSCEDLWQFVPSDAAVVVSNGADEDYFMMALKHFIEKQCAILSLDDTSGNELQLLRAEANLQLQKHKSALAALTKHDNVEADVEIHHKTTIKLGTEPTSARNAEIQEAMAMLSKGIGVLKERAPDMLQSEASQEWEALRARLAEMNEQVKALQRRSD